MDKSMDSIGSCSLDVDADSTDFSDTSGSLNLITPNSAKDITKEFTSRIKERCQISQTTPTLQQTTTILDPISGKINTILISSTEAISPVKKPSYLNLACCVNGYSNLTTYDSKLRQNINKSREVSPIRPSASTIQYCKGVNNLLVPPTYKYSTSESMNYKHTTTTNMESGNKWNTKGTSCGDKTISDNNGIDTTDDISNFGSYLKVNNYKIINPSSTTNKDINNPSGKSFIQQRVERLYGTEAIAKGFYSPKKNARITTNQENVMYCDRFSSTKTSTVTANGNGAEMKIKSDSNKYVGVKTDDTQNFGSIDLPVFRHLRPEFRAQLPTISPKKTVREDQNNSNGNYDIKTTKSNQELQSSTNYNNDYNFALTSATPKKQITEISSSNDIFLTSINNNNNNNNNISTESLTDFTIMSDAVKSISYTNILPVTTSTKEDNSSIDVPPPTDENNDINGLINGNHFIKLLKIEQDRLLKLAVVAENELELLSKNEDISEDVLGYLRSAAGKARLLVSQKMKQFEGLCYKNLNPQDGDKFPTTIEDLQGFWDMVNLQIDHIDSIFNEMEILKANDWKKTEDTGRAAPSGAKLTRRPLTSNPKIILETNGNHGKKSTNSLLAAEKREAQRKKLMELKRKNKVAMATKIEKNDSFVGDVVLNKIPS